jgi:organic radical activating enzyme
VDRLAVLAQERGQTCHFNFSGGEVTFIDDFDVLLKRIHDAGCKVSFISNGSRPIDWWKEVKDYLTAITLTFHIERASLDHFIRVARFLSETLRVHINVTVLPDRFDECVEAAKQIAAQANDVTITLKPLLVDFRSQLYPYTEEQHKMLAEVKLHSRLTRKIVSSRGQMRMNYRDGEVNAMDASHVLANGLNRWSGWNCNIGIERLYIVHSGDIFRGNCEQGGKIGHVQAIDEFRLPRLPVACSRLSCDCISDVMTTRWKHVLARDALCPFGRPV